VLVVGWFQSFQDAARHHGGDPFLAGRHPARARPLHAFFTATSMIGFIAGAGIVVRNSIILVDFIELAVDRRACRSMQAVIDAGAVRFRPMLLTAAAVVVGAFMILFDPIFQGLAICAHGRRGRLAAAVAHDSPIVYFTSSNKKEIFGHDR
jgi:hypothetical protein